MSLASEVYHRHGGYGHQQQGDDLQSEQVPRPVANEKRTVDPRLGAEVHVVRADEPIDRGDRDAHQVHEQHRSLDRAAGGHHVIDHDVPDRKQNEDRVVGEKRDEISHVVEFGRGGG